MYKFDSNNQVIATITHDESIDTPLSITNANGTFYYHRDHQGSIIALTDSTGAVVESFTYDNHYGIITNHTKDIETNNPYGYTGRVVDAKDLYYYRARYYDPTLQRFISQDPIGFASGDFNWYRYVGNSPVNFVDPEGLWKWWWEKAEKNKKRYDKFKNATHDSCYENFRKEYSKCGAYYPCQQKCTTEWYACDAAAAVNEDKKKKKWKDIQYDCN